MTRWKIERTVWGWSLFWDGELVCSNDDPWSLVAYTLHIREYSNPSFN